MPRTVKRRNRKTKPRTKATLPSRIGSTAGEVSMMPPGEKSNGEPVPYMLCVARVLTAMHNRNAYGPDHRVTPLRLSEDTGLSIEEVIAAANGTVTRKYAIIVKRLLLHDGIWFYLASADRVEDFAEVLRERARDLQVEAKEWEKLARRMDYDDTVAK